MQMYESDIIELLILYYHNINNLETSIEQNHTPLL